MFNQILINLDRLFNTSSGFGLIISFVAGVLAGFSPCIYPLIPITLGVIGKFCTSTKLHSAFVSLIFVLGVATLYTGLGVIASLAGLFLASFIVNPITYFILFLIFFVLGLSEYGFFSLPLAFFSVNYPQVNSRNLFSLFILGIISGLAMIPCNFPVLFSILDMIAAKRNIVYGGVALFIFSLGYGTLLIFFGIFGSLIRTLPKHPFWSIIAKNLIASVLIAVSIYFLYKCALMIY